jgi:cytochrome b561
VAVRAHPALKFKSWSPLKDALRLHPIDSGESVFGGRPAAMGIYLPKLDRDTVNNLRSSGARAGAHGVATRVFHWLGAAFLLYAFIQNGERTRVLANPEAMRIDVILGTSIAVLFISRLIWVYFFRGGTRLPTDSTRWEKAASILAHSAIYISLAAVLISGFAIAYLRPGVEIVRHRRRLTSNSPPFVELIRFHVGASDFLRIVIFAHIAFALWHWFVRENGLWESMTGRSFNGMKDSLKERFLSAFAAVPADRETTQPSAGTAPGGNS